MPKFKPANVPPEISEIDSWLVWKLEPNPDPTKKPLKVPYYADGKRRRGALGTKEDRRKLTSFERCLEVYRGGGFTGLGFAPMPDHGITILDLDDCIGETGELSDFAETVVASDTYVEISPSGKGLRAVYTGGAVIQGKKNGHLESGERVEIYCGSAFVTITGDPYGGEPSKVVDLPKRMERQLLPVIGNGGHAAKEPNTQGLMSPDAGPIPDLTVDHAKVVLNKLPETWGQPGHGTWYRVAAALHLQFDGSEEAYELLDAWSQGIEGYDEGNNRKRWNAGFAHGSGKEGITTMRNLVFEAIQNGGLKVRRETMQKWRLARPAEDDFEDSEVEQATLPEFADLAQMADIGNMLDEDAPPIDWLVKDFIARRNVSILAGGSGTSKSYFTMQMCGRAAVGMEDFGGMVFRAGGFRTLYLAYEDTKEVMHLRVKHIKSYLGDHVDLFGDEDYVSDLRTNFSMLTSEVLDSGAFNLVKQVRKYEPVEVTALAGYLKEYITSRGIDLVVFDTASEVHTGDENSANDMVVLMRVFRQLATSANCGVLIIQHVQKGIWNLKLSDLNQSSIRGSSVLVDKARNVGMLARMPKVDAKNFGLPDTHDTHDTFIAFKHVKANLGGYVPLTVFERSERGLLVHRADIQEVDPAFAEAAEVEGTEEKGNTRRKIQTELVQAAVLDFIRRENKEGSYPSGKRVRSMVHSESGYSDDRVRAAIDILDERGDITKRESDDPSNRSSNWQLSSPI